MNRDAVLCTAMVQRKERCGVKETKNQYHTIGASVDIDAASHLEQLAATIRDVATILAGKHKAVNDWILSNAGKEDLRIDMVFSLGILIGELDQIISAMKNYHGDYTKFRDVFMTEISKEEDTGLH